MRWFSFKALAIALLIVAIMFAIPAPKANAMDEELRTETENVLEYPLSYMTEDGLWANTGIITEVNGTEITFMDFGENIWVFYSDAGDWDIGDRVAVVMDSMGTEIIYDDEILAVKYCGWEF